MRPTTLAFCILLACGLTGQAAKKPVTLDDVGGRPMQRGGGGETPVWAPDGARYAYLTTEALMLFDIATGQARQVAPLAPMSASAVKAPPADAFNWQNRRVQETRAQWAPDGTAMLLALGGDLFLVDIATGKWQQLTATAAIENDAKISPDGASVAFVRGNELYALEIKTRKERRLTTDSSATLWNARLDWVYPEELDLGTAYWWAPDSKRLAYLQFDLSRQMVYPHGDLLPVLPVFEPQRYPKAGTPNADVRLGVVAAAGGATRWMDLGETRDHLLARVDWASVDSILVQKLNRVQDRLDLLAADAGTGAARLVLRETDPAWVNVANDLRVVDNGKSILWSSERSGYRHLYIVSMDGKVKRQLTSGAWQVNEVSCVDAGTVYYMSGEASPLENQLYRVGLDGKGKRRLTEAAGTHAVRMSPNCAYFTDAFSSLTEPARRSLVRTETGAVARVLQEPDRRPIDEFDLRPVEIVPVKAADGETLYAKMIRPANFEPGKKYPAVVMVYGGPHSQSVRNAWAGLSLEQVLAHRGFVVWQLDNRGSSGRGHKWEAKLYRRLGRQELEDQKEGVRHLVSLGFVDGARVGIHGWSYGGFMTLYALLNSPGTFRAGAAGAPVTDWRNYDTIYTERYLGLPSENGDGYRDSSPVNQAAQLRDRVLLIHNIQDDNVLFQNTMQMAAAFERAGKQFEMMVYPQKTHGVTGVERRHLNQLLVDYFERNLK